jgi:hypothetical protein
LNMRLSICHGGYSTPFIHLSLIKPAKYCF